MSKNKLNLIPAKLMENGKLPSNWHIRWIEGINNLCYDDESYEIHGTPFVYECGILTVMKNFKFENDRLISFYNLDGKQILEINNFNMVNNSYLNPKESLEVEVYENCLRIIRTNLETKQVSESFVDILTGKKLSKEDLENLSSPIQENIL